MDAYRARDADDAIELLAEHGLCWIEDVLSPKALEECHTAALSSFAEVLRTLVVQQVVRERAGQPPEPVRFAEVVERDGGRFDVRHRMSAEPFGSLLAESGAAAALLPVLRGALGMEAVKLACGQVVAMSIEGWAETLGGEGIEDFGAQAWHTDGPVNLFDDGSESVKRRGIQIRALVWVFGMGRSCHPPRVPWASGTLIAGLRN